MKCLFMKHAAAFDEGLAAGRPMKEMAKEFGVSHDTVYEWKRSLAKGHIPGSKEGKPTIARTKPSTSDNPYIHLLRERRLAMGATLKEVAEKSYMSIDQVSKAEMGRNRPLLDSWLALIEALGGEVLVKFQD